MGGRPKQTFSQRTHTDGQEAQAKMFNIANYQKNANQSYNEISPHTSQNGHNNNKKKNLQTTNAGEDVEKRQPFNAVGGNVSWYSHYGEQYGCSLKN